MEPEKPLHVRVAEALGWEFVEQQENELKGGFWIRPDRERWESPPRYDTDWSATGPLIEKHGIWLGPAQDGSWRAFAQNTYVGHLTPLLASCGLILALAKEGKL